ncbi:hypothetical protein SpCBS45565_g08004 [Spizellomyces sp. 'palustris']|nr:hypothetical protein SpCBS45565_g08004 [Spizellomyces sp. 'palustris']
MRSPNRQDNGPHVPSVLSSPPPSGSGESKGLSQGPEPSKVDHVCFVVHGMGRQRRYVQNLESLRRACKEVIKEEFPHRRTHIAWVPIEWHQELHQMDSVDRRMKTVTLPTCSILRTINNDILADVLYYFSSFHGQTILKIVAKRLNEAYAKFSQDHPDFDGKVILVGHSLGGIICYDLLSNMEDAKGRDGVASSGNSREPSMERPPPPPAGPYFAISYPKLTFRPAALFSLGSPVPATLIMRGQSIHTYRPPPDILFHNIFHLYDPLSYRIEPLLNYQYAEIPPVLLQRPSARNSNFSYYKELISSYLPDLSSMASSVRVQLPTVPSSMAMPMMPAMPSMPQLQIPSLPRSMGVPSLSQFTALREQMFAVMESMYSSVWAGGFSDEEDEEAEEEPRAADDGINGWVPNKRMRMNHGQGELEKGPDLESEDDFVTLCEATVPDESRQSRQRGSKRKRACSVSSHDKSLIQQPGSSQNMEGVCTSRRIRRPVSKLPSRRASVDVACINRGEFVERHAGYEQSSTVVQTETGPVGFESARSSSYTATVTESMSAMAEIFRRSLFEPVVKALEMIAGGAEDEVYQGGEIEASQDDQNRLASRSTTPDLEAEDRVERGRSAVPHTLHDPLNKEQTVLDVGETVVSELLGKDEAKRLIHQDAEARSGVNSTHIGDSETSEHATLPVPEPPAERLDYYVQDNIIDNVVQQYLIGLKAHFSYCL